MKRNLVLSSLFILLLSFTNFAVAQTTKTMTKKTPDGRIRCFTTEHEEYLKISDPTRETREQFENWIAPKIAEMKANKLANTTTIITIPVVVHVISNGDAIGSGENISDAQVLSQINVLNQDFRKLIGSPGYNSSSVGADVQLEFCMAQRTPTGTATTGIDRVTRTASSYSTEAATETMKAATSWDPTQYFNIWSVFFSNSTSAAMNGVLGYAQFPSTSGLSGLATNGGAANTDGLVIEYRAFGTSDIVPSLSVNAPYDKGRTASHEIGHCLGLIHIWGDATCGEDYCADTPVAHTSNFNCPTVTNCDGTGNEMVENYMDYTDDLCMNIFTLNQKERISAVMTNSPRRASLKTSLACSPPLASKEFEYFNSIRIVPNPVRDVLNITIGQSELPDSLTIYNELGQTVLSKKVSSNEDLSVNTDSYSIGNYILTLTKNNTSRAYHFIKE